MNSHISGKSGEKIAEAYLLKKGYIFIARNYKVYPGEIDLIFQDGSELVFVEVKSWKNLPCLELERSILGKKQWRIITVSKIFVTENWEKYKNFPIRYDVIFIDGRENIIHYKNALGEY